MIKNCWHNKYCSWQTRTFFLWHYWTLVQRSKSCRTFKESCEGASNPTLVSEFCSTLPRLSHSSFTIRWIGSIRRSGYMKSRTSIRWIWLNVGLPNQPLLTRAWCVGAIDQCEILSDVACDQDANRGGWQCGNTRRAFVNADDRPYPLPLA